MEGIKEKARIHCIEILRNSRCDKLPFHNVHHTLEVYKNTSKIAAFEGLSETEVEPVLLAALFHDTGNAITFKGHEELSASNAAAFLEKEKYGDTRIPEVVRCIKATEMPQTPLSKLEGILCDADLFHLGRKDFFVHNELLRTEWEQYHKKFYSNYRWYSINIEFLNQHEFHTGYGKQFLEPVKLKNSELFQSLLTNMQLI